MLITQAFPRLPGTHPPPADAWLIQLLSGGPAPEIDQIMLPWPELAQAAYRHGLGPALFARLREEDRLTWLPDDIRRALESAYYHTLAVNTGVHAELARLLEHFQRADIPVVLLKGAALLQTLYPDAGQRPLGDIDLLIPLERVEDAGAYLVEAGYALLPELHPGFGRRYHVEQAWLRRHPPHQQIDLHWHLFGRPYYRRRTSIDWFWAQSRCLPQGQLPARIFSPEAQLLHLAAHAMLHHRGSRLALVLRPGAPADGPDAGVAAGLFCGQTLWACCRPCAPPCRWYRPSGALPFPPFRSTLQTRWVERGFYAAITSRHSASRVLLDGLSLGSVRAACGLWGRLLFPDQAFMQRRYGQVDKRLLPLLYAYRAGSGLARTALATGRTLLEAPWRPS